jgi:hypothetical protein
MPTFLQAQTAVLDYINRPSSEMLTVVKREINLTILWMQRMHKFQYSERVIRLTYPATAVSIDLTEPCGGRLRDVINLQLLSTDTGIAGRPLWVRSFDAIIQERSKFLRGHRHDEDELPQNSDLTFDSWVTRNASYYGFLSGENLGLYPTPTVTQYLLINLHIWLAELSADSDTNFLLENCYDFIILKTLQRYNTYSKQDGRNPVSAEELAILWEGIKQWDGQVMVSTPPTV